MLKELIKYGKELYNYNSPLRPPGAVPENEFISKCIKCNKCLQICPYDSIIIADYKYGGSIGTPIIIPRDVPCYVCMKCTAVCPTGALDNNLIEKENVRMGSAYIDEDRCLPFNGIICRACFENCPIFRKAIILEDEFYPKVDKDYCVGCGICERVCPVEGSAIIIKSNHLI